jgi:hypothetical protein
MEEWELNLKRRAEKQLKRSIELVAHTITTKWQESPHLIINTEC